MSVEIAADIRKGNIIEYTDGQLYVVLKAESFRPGKGTPTTTIDMLRISDGIKISNTYKTSDKVEGCSSTTTKTSAKASSCCPAMTEGAKCPVTGTTNG